MNSLQGKGKFHTDISLASSDESTKETTKDSSDEETPVPEPQDDTGVKQEETISAPIQPQEQPVQEETAEEKAYVAKDILIETHEEGDDGWQPVQRLRSAGSYGRRLKQRRATIGKVYTYQKRNMDSVGDYPSVKSTNQNSRYYLVKKRPISHGSFADHHSLNSSQGTKYGRRMIKAVTYRVKSMPSSEKTRAEGSGNGGEPLSFQPESRPSSGPKDTGSWRNSIVSLGKSPSYKEVAVAPPGSIAMLQVRAPEHEITENQEVRTEKQENGTIETNEDINTMEKRIENTFEEQGSASNVTNDLKAESGVKVNEETQVNDAVEENSSLMVSLMVSESEERLKTADTEVHDVVQDSISIDGKSNSLDSSGSEFFEKASSRHFDSHDNSNPRLQVVEDLKDKPSALYQGEIQGLPNNRKLSASAAPFNPSLPSARASPVPLSMTLPPGPGTVPAVATWPVNIGLHPGPANVIPAVNPMCSSPHHPFPSPPPTPNMMQPLPFVYPPYTQPQAVPARNFPVTTGAFHHSHFQWQCGVNPNVPEFIPATFWPGCHPMEFSVPAPVVEPIADPVVESKAQSEDSMSSNSAPIMPVDIDTMSEVKRDPNFLDSKAMEGSNEVSSESLERIKENGHVNVYGTENSISGSHHSNVSNGNAGSSIERNVEGEKTFSILIRGRRNRKQTLRMPVSLLSRPYGSQSFKVIYNRVVRGSEAPKSIQLSSSGDSTASVA